MNANAFVLSLLFGSVVIFCVFVGSWKHESFVNDNIKPVIFSIAKYEQKYIKEYVTYHLSIGFETIYLYDNEDVPTYAPLLAEFGDKVYVVHMPGPTKQYEAMECFTKNIMPNSNFTHVINLDCDEFVVLKQHDNIQEFIREYIKDDCAGIAINWRFFGDSGNQVATDDPLMLRFTKCEEAGNHHVKTLFDKRYFLEFNTMHNIIVKPGYYIKSTNGTVVDSPWNDDIDLSVVQINHYKTKTRPEFQHIRTRGRADINQLASSDQVNIDFDFYNRNEIDDFTGFNYYMQNLQKGIF